MSDVFDSPLDGDVEIHLETELDLTALAMALAASPGALTLLADAVRAQLLVHARGLGNLYGPTAAQSKTPLASVPQPPGTLRLQ